MRRVLVLLSLLIACQQSKDADLRLKDARLAHPPSPEHPIDLLWVEPDGSGRIRYLGYSIEDPRYTPNQPITWTHFFKVETPASYPAKLFVHGDKPRGGRFIWDHDPAGAAAPIQSWKAGEYWKDTQTILMPEEADGAIQVWIGLFRENQRWTVEAKPGLQDGRNRVRAMTLMPSLEALKLPVAKVSRLKGGKLQIDGKLDEPAWKDAIRLRFSDSMGRRRDVRYPTELRLLWDDQFLYAAFIATDPDISDPYQKRDDPIYEHEAVELFLMPHQKAPDTGPYVELQASPGGVIFDAAFTGPRQNMDKRFNADLTVGTQIEGQLKRNDAPRADPPDRRWVSEWAIAFQSLRGVQQAPKAGEEWRMNAFRIDKSVVNGQKTAEYTAWSPPKVGDFHKVERFGRLIFVP